MKHLFLVPLFFLVSCLKSTEDIRRDKLVDQLDTQMQDSQTLVAEMTAKLKDFEQRVASVGGQIETLEHNQNQSIQGKLAQLIQVNAELEKRIKELENKSQSQDKLIASLIDQVESQKDYIKKVSSTLGTIAKDSSGGNSSSKNELAVALKLVDQKKFKEAKPKLDELMAMKLSDGDNNKVFHAQGLVSLNNKKYEDAIVFFSKIYTKWPKSSLAASSLFHIGKAFAGQGKKDEAGQIFDELKNKYPNSPFAKMGQDEKKKL